MTLYVIRHGETEFNRLGIVQGSGVDADLNEIGLHQAQRFYEHYQTVPFELVITSNLKRTQQTVQRFIDRGVPWVKMIDMNEISWGDHEGLKPNPARIAQYQQMIESWEKGELEASLPNGESANELAVRVGRFIDWLKKRPEKHILVATHGRTLRCFVTLLKGIGPAAMETAKHENTGLYLIHYQNDKFIFEQENSTEHLSKT
jgi:broad specificity phosphatase PhoE